MMAVIHRTTRANHNALSRVLASDRGGDTQPDEEILRLLRQWNDAERTRQADSIEQALGRGEVIQLLLDEKMLNLMAAAVDSCHRDVSGAGVDRCCFLTTGRANIRRCPRHVSLWNVHTAVSGMC